jgi:hypothetical protein
MNKLLVVLGVGVFISSNLWATKDYNAIEKLRYGNIFVNACANGKNKQRTELQQLKMEKYCRCVWDGIKVEYTNQEFKMINNKQQPLYGQFVKFTESKARDCLYIVR